MMDRPRATEGRAPAVRSVPASPHIAKLSWADRLDILDSLSPLLDQYYVHLTLKRALYGFDIIRALDNLRQRSTSMSDIAFHRELTTLVNRLRDAHTQYQGPWSRRNVVASLPFLVETYGPLDEPTYIVSKIDNRALEDKYFVEGVEITHWNGIPIDRAVDLHAEVETGGRPESRRARALESLTFRSLEYAPPPNEEWINIDFIDLWGKPRRIRMVWQGIDVMLAPNADRKSLATRFARSIHFGAEAVRRAKKYRFNRALWKAERAAVHSRSPREQAAAEFADFLSSRTVITPKGEYGYLRIWSFDVEDDQRFIEAAISIVGDLPDRGLIIDIRNNPGGLIWAAERLLQIFTPNPIEPTRFALRATPATAEMARAVFNRDELGPWSDSLNSAEGTGEPYSSHIPITSEEQCNNLGQRYGGPVVAVADANTYSSGDLFAAGIVDNRIGPLVCIGDATGAGGANVWSALDLSDAIRPTKLALPKFPDGVGFTMAIRRAVRAGGADGSLIEDAGVAGQPYVMTGTDVLNGNRDLIEHCAEILGAQPWSRMNVKQTRSGIEVETVGLNQLDVFVDGYPAARRLRLKANGTQILKLRPKRNELVEIVGRSAGTIRQRRRIVIS